MNEIWKDIDGFNGKYQISNLGRVASMPRVIDRGVKGKKRTAWKLLSLRIYNGNSPYFRCTLFKNGRRYYRDVHVLVAKAFIGKRPYGHHVHHTDNNKTNNHVKNLIYLPVKDHLNTRKMPRGENHHLTTLTENQVREIRYERKMSNTTYQKLAEKHNTTKRTIYCIVKRITWKHVK